MAELVRASGRQAQVGNWTRAAIAAHPAALEASVHKSTDAARPKKRTQPAGVRLTHPERLVYPDAGLTKQDLADYYARLAERMLPYVSGRPLTLLRGPQGQSGECFIQRHLKAPHVHKVPSTEISYVDSAAGLASLVQNGVLEVHTWGCKLPQLEHPDTMVFDLDPGPHVTAGALVHAAQQVRRLLAAQDLRSFVKRTGGRGLHVVVPLRPEAGWEAIKAFAHSVAARLEAEEPERYTASSSKAERLGRVFIDYHRNVRTASAVAPYSTRAHPGAPVAWPMAWESLSAHALAETPHVGQAASLLLQQPDPWADFFGCAQGLTGELATR